MKIERHIGYMVGTSMVLWIQSLANRDWTRPKVIVVLRNAEPIHIYPKSEIFNEIESEGATKPSIASAQIIIKIAKKVIKQENCNQTSMEL